MRGVWNIIAITLPTYLPTLEMLGWVGRRRWVHMEVGVHVGMGREVGSYRWVDNYLTTFSPTLG